MASLAHTYALYEALLQNKQLNPEQLQECVQRALVLTREPHVNVLNCYQQLKQLPADKSPVAIALFAVLLLAWSCQQRQTSTAYRQLLLTQCLLSHLPCSPAPHYKTSQLIRCAQHLTQALWQGLPLAQIFSRFSRYPLLQQGMEILAQVMLPFLQEQAEPIVKKLRPFPRKLLIAIRDWPENDILLPKIITALEQQEQLQQRIRVQATAFTEQHRLLSVKQALLLLGPEASRELMLITHFEAHLTYVYMPLRQDFLERRRLLAFSLKKLAERLEIVLPCHADLLSYLLVIDAWYHPELSQQLYWCYPSAQNSAHMQASPPTTLRSNSKDQQQKLPDTLAHWQPIQQPFKPLRALKLIDYWQLPPILEALLTAATSDPTKVPTKAQPQKPDANNKLTLLLRLALLTSCLLLQEGDLTVEQPTASWQKAITQLLPPLDITWQDFQQLQHQLVQHLHPYCPYEPLPL